MIFLVSLQ